MIWAFLTEKGLAGLRNGWWLLIAALGCIALYLAITGLRPAGKQRGDARRDRPAGKRPYRNDRSSGESQ